MSYGYNLASDVTTFTFPSGRIKKTAYDSANWINNVRTLTTTTHPSTQAPSGTHGTVLSTAWSLATDLLRQYDGRGHNANTLWQITNRNLQIGSAFPVTLGFTYGAAGKNNGNLTQQTIVTTAAAPNPPLGVSIPAVNLTKPML